MLGNLTVLARLRNTLDFMPSPVPEKPGLLIRDPFQFSESTLIIPPALVESLEYFDGEHTEADLREYLVRLTGDLEVGGLIQHLQHTLSIAGFLEDEVAEQQREAAWSEFRDARARMPSHAGSAYPEDPVELKSTIAGYMDGAARESSARVRAIAAPHVSPFGGIAAYRAAYSALSPEDADRTFVVLGTSHYGQPERLGLTRKPFVTPFGETAADPDLVNRLAASAGEGVLMEDYCHAVEHSIEFQVVFLQHLFGPRIRVVPILCGAFARSLYQGGLPEDDDAVNRALGALGELAAREGDKLLWVLGVDMAHMGRRYGDSIDARAGEDVMQAIELRDRKRIQHMEHGDARAFWDLVQENHDDLKWCGAAPIYAFLRAIPEARGRLLQYQQWNIDDRSVVSFAGMSFSSHTGA
jgi:AmmeMemoRadiSam system protein B